MRNDGEDRNFLGAQRHDGPVPVGIINDYNDCNHYGTRTETARNQCGDAPDSELGDGPALVGGYYN